MKHVIPGKLLAPVNVDWLSSALDKDKFQAMRPFLQLLCEVGDAIARDEDVWISIGATRNHSSLVLTVHQDSGNLSVFAETALDLLISVPEIL